KYQDGTPVTTKDVKYAIERTFDRGVLSNGPNYFTNLLGGNAKTYPGPYKDRAKNLMGLTAIDTPDATTIVFHLKAPSSAVNNRLLVGEAQVDVAGTGGQAAARAKILSNPTLKAQSDGPLTGFGWFFYIDSQVAPFTNLACRQAIEYATNRLTMQNAYGGPV